MEISIHIICWHFVTSLAGIFSSPLLPYTSSFCYLLWLSCLYHFSLISILSFSFFPNPFFTQTDKHNLLYSLSLSLFSSLISVLFISNIFVFLSFSPISVLFFSFSNFCDLYLFSNVCVISLYFLRSFSVSLISALFSFSLISALFICFSNCCVISLFRNFLCSISCSLICVEC